VVATEKKSVTPAGSSLLAAALLLPGLMHLAQAESPPEQSELSFKFLSYQDSQPGLERIKVSSPSLGLVTRLGDHWSVSAQATHDAISGASPRYHSAISSASQMHEERNAYELGATRYFERASLSLGVNGSKEHDYRSQGLSLEGKLASEDNNSTWSLGVSHSDDTINPVNLVVVDAKKRTTSWMLGLTQVWTSRDVLQLNLGYTTGSGYFSDPYKIVDNRPDSRDQRTLYLAWNHYVDAAQAALRTSYRYYNDSWGIKAHTLNLEWAQKLAPALSLTPSLRYTTQSAVSFYYNPTYDPVLGAPFPVGYSFGNGQILSPDQRLSAFGAITLGLKADWQFNKDMSFNLALDRYQQRASWRFGGGGSPGLADFNALMIQTGLDWKF